MLENMGASSVIAIEANSRAYLKCLITKEILNLRCSRFLIFNPDSDNCKLMSCTKIAMANKLPKKIFKKF